jgi:hypothetical protein
MDECKDGDVRDSNIISIGECVSNDGQASSEYHQPTMPFQHK